MNRRELINQLIATGDMNDEVMIVNQNSASDDDEASVEIVQVGDTDDGVCYLYFAGDDEV